MSDIGEHFGHLRNTIGVIDLFPNDPAWKKPNTDENSENFSPGNHSCNREITVQFFEFKHLRRTVGFVKETDEM